MITSFLITYVTVVILLFLMTIIICISVFNNIIKEKKNKSRTFKIFNLVRLNIPDNTIKFMGIVLLSITFGIIISVLWPIYLLSLIYAYKFNKLVKMSIY